MICGFESRRGQFIQIHKSVPAINFVKNIKLRQDYLEICTTRNKLISTVHFIKLHSLLQCNNLIDIVVVDCPNKLFRFNITYIFSSFSLNNYLLITTQTTEFSSLPSLINLFQSAN